MKKSICLIVVSLVFPSAAMAGYTSTPKPSYSAPKTYSAPKVVPTVKTYTPPTKPYSPPTQIPRAAPYSAFHDIHATNYWANPASPYFYLWLAQYGNHDSGGGSTAWWVWALIVGALIAVVGGTTLMISRL